MSKAGLHNAEEWYAAEGEGKVSLREVMEKLLPAGVPAKAAKAPAKTRAAAPLRPAAEAPRVVVSGISNLALRFARCCSPKPGDPLQGIVTRSQGVSIHHRDCGNVRRVRLNTGRLVEAEWYAEEPAERPGWRTIRLVVSADKKGKGLANVKKLLNAEGTPIEAAASISSDGSREVQRLTVRVGDNDQAARILHRLNAMAGVRAVRELESA
jgi:GTP pyrophosphokinase